MHTFHIAGEAHAVGKHPLGPRCNLQPTLAQTKGSVKDVQGVLGHSRPDITATVYMQQIESGREADARCDLLRADGKAGSGCRGLNFAANLVRFGTVGVLCRSVSDRIKTVGA
jgi:hypothetical protein